MPVSEGSKENKGVPFKMRLAVYLGLWALAIIACELFYQSEPGDNVWLARLFIVVAVPFYSVFGFVFMWMHDGRLDEAIIALISLAVFVTLAILILTKKRPVIFYTCSVLQTLALAGITYIFYLLSRPDFGP